MGFVGNWNSLAWIVGIYNDSFEFQYFKGNILKFLSNSNVKLSKNQNISQFTSKSYYSEGFLEVKDQILVLIWIQQFSLVSQT
jgi:hypothetical protein